MSHVSDATEASVAPSLRTDRLQMRPLVAADLDELMLTVGRADVMAHYVDLVDRSSGWSRETTADFIVACSETWIREGFGRWGLIHRGTGRLIGYCGLSALDYLPAIGKHVELSFRLHPDFWGVGLGSEAASAALDWAFKTLTVDSIFGSAVPENVGSLRVLSKLGLKYHTTQPYHSPVSGRDACFIVNRMTRKAWRASHPPVAHLPGDKWVDPSLRRVWNNR